MHREESSPAAATCNTPSAPQRRWRIALALYWAVLLVATHAPTPQPVEQAMQLDVDKLVHFGAFFVLTTLMLRGTHHGPSRKHTAIAVVALAYAAFDETTQPFTGRVADPLDWLADAIGVVAAIGLDRWLQREPGPSNQ